MTGRVVYDSDDDSDLSPRPRAPVHTTAVHRSRPATPPRAMVALMEPSPLLDTLSMPYAVGAFAGAGADTFAAAASATIPTSSTDPSFFQNVYEDQQRALGAQLSTERDLWDVPSSPMRPPARPSSNTSDSAKRKRGTEAHKRDTSSSNEPPKRQRQQQQTDMSIALEPMTPSMLHQHPQLLSSSMDQSYPGEVTHTLGRALHNHSYDCPPMPLAAPPPPQAYPTQSTVAFPTPSVYASSGRRGVGSSSDTAVNNAHAAADEAATVPLASTPPRKARAALLLSSPDIIAGPVPLPASAEAKATKQADDDDDELSIGARPPVRHEIDESGSELSFHSSPGREPSPAKPAPKKKAKKIIIIKKPAIIAASDDDDFSSSGEDDLAGNGGGGGGVHDVPLSDDGMNSDFSAKASKKKPAKKVKEKAAPKAKAKATAKKSAKKGIIDADASSKNSEVLLIELPDHAPPRNRPKQVAKTEYKDSEDESALSDVAIEAAAAASPPKPAPKPKSKAKKGRGSRKADSKAEPVGGAGPSTSATALGETSGNAVSVSASIPDKPVSVEEATVSPASAPVEETPASSVVRPAASGLTTGLGMGLGGTGPARVLYRVGLSKKTRIAPLLKIVRK